MEYTRTLLDKTTSTEQNHTLADMLTSLRDEIRVATDLMTKTISNNDVNNYINVENPYETDNTEDFRFSIALSFSGECRGDIVLPIANKLSDIYGKRKILYDEYHKAEFARWNLADYLPELYNKHSDLIVVFLGESYNESSWCGLEWRAIRDLLLQHSNEERVMFIKTDDGEVNGFFGRIDGYINVTNESTDDVCNLIVERYNRLKRIQRHPSNIMLSNTAVDCVFSYAISVNGTVCEVSAYTLAHIKSWYKSRRSVMPFRIKIDDIRIFNFDKKFYELDRMIQHDSVLTEAQTKQYVECARLIKVFRTEYELKNIAVKYFLSNEFTWGCLRISDHVQINEFILMILNFQYYNQSKVYHKPQNRLVEISVDSPFLNFPATFVARISKADIDLCIKEAGLNANFRHNVSVLNLNCQRKIAMYYFFFIAELKLFHQLDMEIIRDEFNFSKLVFAIN